MAAATRPKSNNDKVRLDDPDWADGLARFARSYRRALHAHPAALAMIAFPAVEIDVGRRAAA
ncbi:hypothetical protein GCM10009733_108720 [Nonomuraea maheshkhaliensis]|uniref:Uracil-DNA glycosylase n=1 Tax=Nonomuraea maheshkhaliensis TaxID=419590 RepID=A0ABP4TX62_9ACTN